MFEEGLGQITLPFLSNFGISSEFGWRTMTAPIMTIESYLQVLLDFAKVTNVAVCAPRQSCSGTLLRFLVVAITVLHT